MSTHLNLLPCSPLIFSWEQQRGHRAIPFGNDPELFCVRDLITAHQAEPVFEAQFVFSLIVLANIAPITTKMAGKKFQRRLGLLQELRGRRVWQRFDLRETVE